MEGLTRAQRTEQKVAEMLRLMEKFPEITDRTLASMLGTGVSSVNYWKRKAGIQGRDCESAYRKKQQEDMDSKIAKLKEHMEKHPGLSTKELAEVFKVTTGTIRNWQLRSEK